MKQYQNAAGPIDGADVVIAGLFPAKEKDYALRLDEVAELASACGGRVVGRFVQRRGASDRWKKRPGGSTRMSEPFSQRTLLTHGEVREIAEACLSADVGAVVFVNALTTRQRAVLPRLLGCPVFSAGDLAARG